MNRRLKDSLKRQMFRQLQAGDLLFIDSSHRSETSLLRAYLAHNHRIFIVFCPSHLHYERQAQLREIFSEYDPAPGDDGLDVETVRPFGQLRGHFPSSIYLETR